MATHSSTLAWKTPWREEPGGLRSMGSLRVGTTERLHFHFSLSCIGEGNGNPLQCSCLEDPRDGGAWQASVYGVAQSQTRLKRLNSSSSNTELTHFSSAISLATAGQWSCLTAVWEVTGVADAVQCHHTSRRTGVEVDASLSNRGDENCLQLNNQASKIVLYFFSHVQAKTSLYHIFQISCLSHCFKNVPLQDNQQ